ncbi:MAG: [protein-PII] uridylyltransferase [Candidatus Competibacteraceae bacterium]
MAEPQLAARFNDRDIFDDIAFRRDLADGAQPLKLFREALKRGSATLKTLFYDGVPACELVPARARLIDRLLRHAWVQFFTPADPALALLAVGGYGRGELHPHSDVDIMILSGIVDIDRYQESLSEFLTFMWDMGLELGHSVRHLQDCVREGTTDISVATCLMEARLLAGPQELFEQMRQLTGPEHIWPGRAFFEAKTEEQRCRYHKFDDTAYNLEPNIKEGPGGLRDLQMIGWVAKRHFGATTLHALVGHGFLSEGEYKQLIDCQNYLWQIRFALHVLTGRREDRLLFDYQRQIALQFGYQDHDYNLAVEQFMQSYYRTMMTLNRLNEMLLQLFEEAILLADEPGEPVPVSRRFQARKGYLEVTREDVFRRYPFALLELFLLLQQHPELKGIRASTIRLIRSHCALIDQSFRDDIRAQSLFLKILRQPRGITRQLRQMNQYGVLEAYLPEFDRIVGRMQYDLFHVYTVDQHILFVVRNLRRFYVPEYAHEFPQCSGVIRRLPKPWLLYIAAIYHDIAKGRNGDHSLLGALDAKKFCRRHGLSKVDTNLVVWLVDHHLVMSLTAQKKDIDDPEMIQEFARQVGDERHLDCLYLLTVADIRATNPKLWNTWRASLLWKLYQSTRRLLRRGLGQTIDKEERIKEAQAQALIQLCRQGIEEHRIEDVWQGFSEDYFLRYSPEEIVWHTRAVLRKEQDERALVLARDDPVRGGTEIFVYTRDREGVFADMVTIMDRLGLSVLDARVITSRYGYTLDSYTVVEAGGETITDRLRIKEIVITLKRELDNPTGKLQSPTRRTPRVLKHFPTPTQVFFSEDEANGRTVLELITADRPGLLSRVGQAFVECGVQLQNAKIATIGARAEDVFFITDRDKKPLGDERKYTLVRQSLIRHLEGAA